MSGPFTHVAAATSCGLLITYTPPSTSPPHTLTHMFTWIYVALSGMVCIGGLIRHLLLAASPPSPPP